ncbi:GNAT family N-acetyltransferase [Streptomyces sp. t39]|uniref:GNAT family N-acetyltransferase n=1 Tax=Streptomyces sp. t39 TaxID=1828156 RepID=UPI0011CDD221|nr:GNAT family N-acetyltransferase [Streptomyces sp. t39]TXS56654.1 GNAT family N-acetyltransferase [Streptomyces sp. t39]
MTPDDPPGTTVTLCRDPRAFTELAPEWGRLHRACGAATPFQSHAWLDSWWRSYGAEGRLRVVLARRDGRLIGAAPLMLVHRPMPLLVPLGGAISDYGDLVVDDGQADRALRALSHGLERAARGAVVDLREVRPGAVAERLYEQWAGPRARLDDSVCMELPAVPVEDLVRRMPAARAQRARSKLRRLDALGIAAATVAADAVPDAVDRLLRLHELQWRGRGVNVEHLRPRFREHLVRAVTRMTADDEATLTEFRMDGEVVAVGLTLRAGRMSGGYLYGADPVLRERKADVATMLLAQDARQAAGHGLAVLSLLRGSEPYKNHWRPEPVTSGRLLLARPALEPLLRMHESRARMRDRAAEVVRTRLPAAREWRGRLNDWRAEGTAVRTAGPASRGG